MTLCRVLEASGSIATGQRSRSPRVLRHGEREDISRRIAAGYTFRHGGRGRYQARRARTGGSRFDDHFIVLIPLLQLLNQLNRDETVFLTQSLGDGRRCDEAPRPYRIVIRRCGRLRIHGRPRSTLSTDELKVQLVFARHGTSNPNFPVRSRRRAIPLAAGKLGAERRHTKIFGRGDRIRTCDIYVPNVALYQSELHPERSIA
jgi:hypothetical protein